MSHRFLFDQRVVGTAVADHDDGEGGQADVNHKVLVVTRLGADLQSEMGERVSFPGFAKLHGGICIGIQL